MSPILAFTGPSGLTITEEAWCRAELRRLRRDGLAVWRSGGAFGLDTLVVQEAGMHQDVRLIYPEGMHWNYALRRDFDFGAGWISGVEGGYRKRNEALVAGADALHAFLRMPIFYRSGEWMTVNIARHADVEVVQHIIP